MQSQKASDDSRLQELAALAVELNTTSRPANTVEGQTPVAGPSSAPSQSPTQDSTAPEPPVERPAKRGRKSQSSGGTADRRKEQNRAAQRTFREKKNQYFQGLEQQVTLSEAHFRVLFPMLHELLGQNKALRNAIGRPEATLKEFTSHDPIFRLYSAHCSDALASSSSYSAEPHSMPTPLMRAPDPSTRPPFA